MLLRRTSERTFPEHDFPEHDFPESLGRTRKIPAQTFFPPRYIELTDYSHVLPFVTASAELGVAISELSVSTPEVASVVNRLKSAYLKKIHKRPLPEPPRNSGLEHESVVDEAHPPPLPPQLTSENPGGMLEVGGGSGSDLADAEAAALAAEAAEVAAKRTEQTETERDLLERAEDAGAPARQPQQTSLPIML